MTAVEVTYVSSGDVELCVQIEGNPSGPTLVFVHGYPDDRHVWDSVVALLQDEFRIVRYDVRGTGDSSVPSRTQDYRMSLLSADLMAVLDATSPRQPVHLVAHDWGSIQSWESVTDAHFASRIASYTSISGPCLDYMGAQNRDNLRSKDLKRVRGVLQQLSRSWYVFAFQIPWLPEQAWAASRIEQMEAQLAHRERLPVELLRSEHRAKNGRNGIQLYRANMLQRLTKPMPRPTAIPVQVLIPLNDGYVGETIARSCTPYVESLHTETFAGGHWYYLGQPELLASQIRSYVGTLGAR